MIAFVPVTGPRPEPPEIRRARPEEYAEVGALVVAAYAAGGLLENDRGYGAHVADVTGRAAEHPVLVATREGRLVGSVTITPHGSPQSELAAEGEVELRYLGVAPEAWGTGVAEALVAGCEVYALETHARALVLCVISDNTVAHRLYTRLGFHRVPERDWSPSSSPPVGSPASRSTAPGSWPASAASPSDRPEMWRHSTPEPPHTPHLGGRAAAVGAQATRPSRWSSTMRSWGLVEASMAASRVMTPSRKSATRCWSNVCIP
jgi:ribosomal protein S18 acetylase RimI-like enzyme